MIEKITHGLSSSDDQLQQDSIYLIGYAFEKFRGHDDGNIPIEVIETEIDAEVVAHLKKVLINYLDGSPVEVNRASAYSALGKSLDESLKGYFIEALRWEIDRSPTTMYQIMIALDYLGEDCFEGKQSLSMFDTGENTESARKYLSRVP